MEITSSQQLLLNDSFSYGWLLNVKSSSSAAAAAELGDSRRSVDTGSYIEIDPNLVVSLRWTTTTTTTDLHGLDLDLPQRQALAEHLLPSQEAAAASNSALLRKSQSVNSNRYLGGGASTASSLLFHSAKSSPGIPAPPRMRRSKLDSRFVMSNCAKSPKKIICKCLCFLMPLYKIVKDLRLLSSTSSSSSSSSSKSTASGGRDSARSSPRSSDALSSIDWCRNNPDISISDAILHCKKSIGQEI